MLMRRAGPGNCSAAEAETMTSRIKFLQVLALAVIGASWALGCAIAQEYPNRPVRWVVGFPPGGPTDIVARLMGQWLQERLGQPFVIENRPGAGGNIATQAVLNAQPDGYTLLMASHANAINATLYQKLTFNFLTDNAPVAGLVRVPNVLEVHPSLPIRTVTDFIAHAKTAPGKISYASAGNGTSAHLAAELFKAMTGVDLQHVPYRGSAPALTDMLAGTVSVMFDSMASSIEHIRAGTLRAIAVTTAARADALPDLPTVAETVPGYDMTGWFGVIAPKGTPAAIVARLNREINLGLADARMKARFAEFGANTIVASPQEFAAYLAAETDNWAKAVKFSGARVD
jgi:tripartite-type tricarboxylate transporter receptor subunit TctC